MRAEQVTDAVTFHGEGPVWWPGWGGLRWVDMLAGDLLTLEDDGSVRRLHVGDVAAFVRPRRQGGYVVALERGIGLSDDPHGPPTTVQELWSSPDVRMNDGGCDEHGVLFAGSMAYDGRPRGGTLWRISPSGEVDVRLADVTISNGLASSPDGSLVYYVDTGTGRVDVLTVQGDDWVDRRPLHEPERGRPDGLTVDAAGNVWVALNGVGEVRCISPTGEVLHRVDVPVRGTTACTLGGPDLRDLYVSTSAEGLDDPEPTAGALYRVRVEVPGLPVHPFAG